MPYFPFELRHLFAQWIEAQQWQAINTGTQAGITQSTQLLQEIMRMMEAKKAELASSSTPERQMAHLKLTDIIAAFSATFAANPGGFVQFITNALRMEQAAFQDAQQAHAQQAAVAAGGGGGAAAAVAPQPKAEPAMNEDQKITAAFHYLGWCIRAMEDEAQQLQQAQETFVIQIQENQLQLKQAEQTKVRLQQCTDLSEQQVLQQRVTQIAAEQQTLDAKIRQEAEQLVLARQTHWMKVSDTVTKLRDLQLLIVDVRIRGWKQHQMLGTYSEEELFRLLNEIQAFVDHLASILWKVRLHTKRLMLQQQQLPLTGDRPFSTMLPHMNKLIVDLIQGSVIVDRQPPQVLKTQTKFAASVRCLCATALNMHMDPPEVQCSIVNELQAQMILQESQNLDAAGVLPQHAVSGDLVNNKKTMHYASDGQVIFSAQFKNIQLKKHKRGGLKTDQVVTEEKFAIVFQLPVRLYGEMSFQVRSMSMPVVVVVHGNQQANAEATILWDNQFGSANRMPWAVPASVPWKKLGAALSHYFAMNIQQALTADNVQYLSTKLLAEGGAVPDQQITWPQFGKESMRDRQFTFWDWFYAAADLIRKHLLGPWQAKLILGFVAKHKVQEELIKCAVGTFILRFSDSAIGGITIAWVGEDEKGAKQVWNLQPWYARDFSVRKLADRVSDLPQLLYLYPRIPKEAAFQEFCSEAKPMAISADYVQSGIAAVIPGGRDRQMTPAPSPAAFGGGGGGGGAAFGGSGFGGAAGSAVIGSQLNPAVQMAAAQQQPGATSNVLPSLNSLTGDLGFG